MRIPEPKTELTLPCPWRRLRYNLECIGWSQNELARRIRLDDSGVRQMCRGAREIPDDVAIWVEQLAAVHRALWEPPLWEADGKSAQRFYVPEFDPDDTEVAVNRQLIPVLERTDADEQHGRAHLAYRGRVVNDPLDNETS